MTTYPFNFIQGDSVEVAKKARTHLANRPFTQVNTSLKSSANRFVPSESLQTAINVALAVGSPLLITGEPGTGKTQAAYYIAHQLDVKPVLHFQVKSNSQAGDLLYHFDAVAYLREAYAARASDTAPATSKAQFIEPRALWEAFESDGPRVVLIDEIDKAPRDFPNDLLHELDQSAFYVNETGQTITAEPAQRPIVIITSNSERNLPDPFLRRCVFHNIEFSHSLLDDIVAAHREDFMGLDPSFTALAVERFLQLRQLGLRKRPSTSELLVWLRVMAMAQASGQEVILSGGVNATPFLNGLIKDAEDMALVLAHH